jgi:hypothetical protein
MIPVIRIRLCTPVTPGHVLALNILVAVLGSSGCGSNPDYQTIHGLQEENKVQKEKIAELEAKIKAGGQDAESHSQAARKECEAQLAQRDELHRQATAQAEKEISDLHLELGATRRERLTLKELLDQQPRIDEANKVRAGFSTMVIWIMFGSVVLLLAYMVYREKVARFELNSLTAKTVSDVRQLGSGS